MREPLLRRLLERLPAAEYLGMSVRQFDGLLAAGLLTRVRLDRRVRVDLRELERLVERAKTQDLAPLARPPPSKRRRPPARGPGKDTRTERPIAKANGTDDSPIPAGSETPETAAALAPTGGATR
jgi:hypothetical protein